ncbi:hypothetical protein MUN88_14160 [Gracilibacillus caseinilyticus]|uniref:Uncharacterized protein n=1 Tax=Gracilibacillus caseinilyticus TaxID=2932256 RepID=A0ABY4ES02_9BACI|nr:hypothetical protein [Gracilibacillus caseinilyticus]UOQ47211.1 hypothetical protein MUN88_14160 [Gracilibacillus caseinilyticus]
MAKQATKKKVTYKIRKVTYGDMPREEAFEKALKPYFTAEEISNNPTMKLVNT